MPSKHHNPERRAWRGRSYRKGGQPVRKLREEDTLKIEQRYSGKAPTISDGSNRVIVTLANGTVLNIVPDGKGVRISLEQPMGSALLVEPRANNVVALHPVYVDEIR